MISICHSCGNESPIAEMDEHNNCVFCTMDLAEDRAEFDGLLKMRSKVLDLKMELCR